MRAVLKDGTVYEGLFHNPIFDRGFGVVLHMARKKVPPLLFFLFSGSSSDLTLQLTLPLSSQESGDTGVIRTPPIDVVTVQPQDLVMLDAPEVAFVEDSAEFKKQMMREGTTCPLSFPFLFPSLSLSEPLRAAHTTHDSSCYRWVQDRHRDQRPGLQREGAGPLAGARGGRRYGRA